MESKRINLFDNLIKKNSNAYIKLPDCNVPIYTDFIDFEYIRKSIDYYNNKKMKFEMINDLPVLLDIKGINKYTFEILYNQLLTETTPIFDCVDQQIYYILLLEQLTSGNAVEIQETIKLVKFDITTYILLVDYGFNLLNYMNKNITINNIINGFLHKYKLLIINSNNHRPLCKFDLTCKSHYDLQYHCKWKHNLTIISDQIKIRLISDLSSYNVLYLGKKEIFNNYEHNKYNYDRKVLSSDNIIYDIIFEDEFAFAHNPQIFIDRDKYEYACKDEYGDDIDTFIDGKLVKCIYVALFKPYRCCSRTIMYHCHGN